MKKFLIATNLVMLAVVVVFAYKHFAPAKKNCSYSLTSFSFHYKKQSDTPRIVMLGDSRIGLANWDSLLHRNDVINRGIYGDKMYCICQRLDYLKSTDTKICFIEGGLLDLYTEDVDSIVTSYKNVIKFWKDNNVIPVINSIVYISPKASEKYKEANKKIETINEKLKTFAQQKNVDYIDLNPILASTTEYLLKDDFSDDGTHFNNAAYKIWATEIEKILAKYNI